MVWSRVTMNRSVELQVLEKATVVENSTKVKFFFTVNSFPVQELWFYQYSFLILSYTVPNELEYY